MPGEWSFRRGFSASIGKLQGQKPCPSHHVKPQGEAVCELGSEPLLETLPFRWPWTSSLRYGESNFPLFIKVSWPMFLVVVCLFVMAAGKRPRSPQCCCCLSSAKAASGSQRETWGAYSQAPQQASCAWFGGSASHFPQVAFSKSHNILCVSVARADAARPRIETFLPRRNDSQAGRPASLSDNRLSHTTEHFKMPFPKNTKNTCKNPLRITYLCPGGWYLQ